MQYYNEFLLVLCSNHARYQLAPFYAIQLRWLEIEWLSVTLSVHSSSDIMTENVRISVHAAYLCTNLCDIKLEK